MWILHAVLHTVELERFCDGLSVLPVVKHPVSTVDFTFNFDMKRFSIIDHFMLPKPVYDNCVEVVNVFHDIDNLSDHNALFMQIGVCVLMCIHLLPLKLHVLG